MIRKTLLHPNWMPAVVLLLGALAAVLLLWTDRIHEKQRNNYLMIDAIMDVQIHTSTFHLWFEEALAGDTNIDMKKAWEDYDAGSHALQYPSRLAANQNMAGSRSLLKMRTRGGRRRAFRLF